MSAQEIAAELPKLTHQERREIARLIFEMEAESRMLNETDRRADANFQLLDQMEASDAKFQAR